MDVVIVSGGKAPSKELLKNYISKVHYIIAADSGCECLHRYDIYPDLLVGDFDSVDKKILEEAKNTTKEILQFPPEKDYTDTEIAVLEAIKKGARKIYLFGATGSRLDHMMGNIGLILSYEEQGVHIEIIDDNNRIYLAKNKMILHGRYGENISFHALSDIVKNFTIKGAKYNLKNGYDMHLLDPRAICNQFLDTPIEINFDSGKLLILHSND